MDMSDINQALLDGLNRIEEKCDKIVDRVAAVEQEQAVARERQKRHADNMNTVASEIHDIKKTLEGQHEQLVDHVSRSNTLQDQHDQFKQALEDIVSRVAPLEQQQTTEHLIEQYEAKKREKLVSRLKDWRTILLFLITAGSFTTGVIGYSKGWFN